MKIVEKEEISLTFPLRCVYPFWRGRVHMWIKPFQRIREHSELAYILEPPPQTPNSRNCLGHDFSL